MFDPYRKWLGIPEGERPPTHYQLLAIAPTETDPEVISSAVVRQSAYVRNFQTGQHAEDATRILNEIATAKTCLLDKGKRLAYDAGLAKKSAAQKAKQATKAAAAPAKPSSARPASPPATPSSAPAAPEPPPLAGGYPAFQQGYVAGFPPATPLPGQYPMQPGYGPGPLHAAPLNYGLGTAGYPMQQPGYLPMAMEDDTPWYERIPIWGMVAGGGAVVALILGFVMYMNSGSSTQPGGPPSVAVNQPSKPGPQNRPGASTTPNKPAGTKPPFGSGEDPTGKSPPSTTTTPLSSGPTKTPGGSGEESDAPNNSQKPPPPDPADQAPRQPDASQDVPVQSGAAFRSSNDADSGPIHRLEFDAEGQYLLSCCVVTDNKGSLKIWDVEHGLEFGGRNSSSAFERRTHPYATAIFQEGRLQIMAVTAGGFFNVSQFRGQGLDSQRVDVARDYRFNKVTSAAVCRDGSLVALGNDEAVCVVEARRKGMAGTIPVAAAVSRLAISPEGRFVSAALSDRTLRTWSSRGGGKDAYKPISLDSPAVGLAYSPDGARLGVACDGGSIQVWEAGRRVEVFHRDFVKRKLTAFAFSPDSDRIILGDRQGRVVICSAGDGKIVQTFRAENSDAVTAVAMSPGGDSVATASASGVVRLWKLAEVKPAD